MKEGRRYKWEELGRKGEEGETGIRGREGECRRERVRERGKDMQMREREEGVNDG